VVDSKDKQKIIRLRRDCEVRSPDYHLRADRMTVTQSPDGRTVNSIDASGRVRAHQVKDGSTMFGGWLHLVPKTETRPLQMTLTGEPLAVAENGRTVAIQERIILREVTDPSGQVTQYTEMQGGKRGVRIVADERESAPTPTAPPSGPSEDPKSPDRPAPRAPAPAPSAPGEAPPSRKADPARAREAQEKAAELVRKATPLYLELSNVLDAGRPTAEQAPALLEKALEARRKLEQARQLYAGVRLDAPDPAALEGRIQKLDALLGNLVSLEALIRSGP
ncbi:MAG TPA: hypothetical protein VEN81_01140, partial [Planctomycetota bacterium]|nr:hypothetical protein [Planctomycetota bacterium]